MFSFFLLVYAHYGYINNFISHPKYHSCYQHGRSVEKDLKESICVHQLVKSKPIKSHVRGSKKCVLKTNWRLLMNKLAQIQVKKILKMKDGSNKEFGGMLPEYLVLNEGNCRRMGWEKGWQIINFNVLPKKLFLIQRKKSRRIKNESNKEFEIMPEYQNRSRIIKYLFHTRNFYPTR